MNGAIATDWDGIHLLQKSKGQIAPQKYGQDISLGLHEYSECYKLANMHEAGPNMHMSDLVCRLLKV